MLPYVLLLAAFPYQALGQVVGKATGFAAGVTGGGAATPAVPKDIVELTKWLTDATPRVILIDKEYNFLTSEGKTSGPGCIPASNTCGAKGQDALNGPNWCNPADKTFTYYVSPGKPIDIKSNKSLVGVGNKGVIRGKGFRIVNGAKNIIIQNIHITDLNPQYIWGGDALQLSGSDLVWIDHNKFSLVGRQMIVTGFESAGRLTISNNEFDGQTSWSASCNGQHYWTMLLVGENDKITLLNNYFHHVSGRGPKVGNDKGSTLHAVNNYFANSDGHNFDITINANVLIEGSVFENCKKPIQSQAGNLFNVPNASAAAQCTALLGRPCALNSLKSSGAFAAYTASKALDAFKGVSNIPAVQAADKVAAYVLANAGIGKLSSSSSPAVTTSAKPAGTTTAKTVATTTKAAATTTKAAAAATTAPSSSGSGTIPIYGQCGGIGWSGGKCVSGTVCKFSNDWYSQCLAA